MPAHGPNNRIARAIAPLRMAHLRAIPMNPSLPTRFQLVSLIIPHPLNRAILAVRVVWLFSFVKCMAPTCVVFFLSQFFFFFQTFSRKFKLGGKDQTRVDVWRSEWGTSIFARFRG